MKSITKETLAKMAKRENRKSEKQIISYSRNLKLCKVTVCKPATNGAIRGKGKIKVRAGVDRDSMKYQKFSMV